MSKDFEEKGESCGAKATQIRAAASKLFMETGYRGTSMDQIAKLADVSKTTLYAYYPSKEGLFLAMVEEEKRRFGLNVPEDLPEDPVEVVTILTSIARTMTDIMTNQSMMGVFRTVLAESGHSPELGRAMWKPDRESSHGASPPCSTGWRNAAIW